MIMVTIRICNEVSVQSDTEQLSSEESIEFRAFSSPVPSCMQVHHILDYQKLQSKRP